MSATITTEDKPEKLPDATICGDVSPLIPPGEYTLGFAHYETAFMFGKQPKVILWFQVMDYSEHFQTKLPRYYNVAKLTGKPGRSGKFSIKQRSDMLREFLNVFPGYQPKTQRLDRIPMSMYKDVFVRGRVDTCFMNSNQKRTHELLHYSVIKELLGVKKI